MAKRAILVRALILPANLNIRVFAQSGSSRHFGSVLATSGLPPTSDMAMHCAN
jgi:hypothetical protein